jgi:hypothetical protein
MARLRRHRKERHPKAHRESVKKMLRTKGILDPSKDEEKESVKALKTALALSGDFDPKKRSKLINKPKVVSFNDIEGRGLIRVLRREDGSHYPEFALYPSRVMQDIGFHMEESLRDARFSLESRGKWVLRTNKFSIFVYV